MKLTINLPLLKLNATFSEETIRYGKNSRIELWRSKKLKKLPESIKFAQDIFFQDNLEMDETFFNSIELDSLDATFELVRMMFDNLQKVVALQEHLEVRFDEIEPISERDKSFHIYDVDGTEYAVFYDRDLMAYAIELQIDTMNNSSMSDIMGQISYVEDYFEVIDVKKTARRIRDKLDKENVSEEDLSNDIYNDDKKLIVWMADEDEYYLADLLHDTFNFEEFAKNSVEDPEMAVSLIDGVAGQFIFNTEVTVEGYDTLPVTIFRMH